MYQSVLALNLHSLALECHSFHENWKVASLQPPWNLLIFNMQADINIVISDQRKQASYSVMSAAFCCSSPAIFALSCSECRPLPSHSSHRS